MCCIYLGLWLKIRGIISVKKTLSKFWLPTQKYEVQF